MAVQDFATMRISTRAGLNSRTHPFRGRSPPRVPVTGRCADRAQASLCSSRAGLLRSDRRVSQELADLLRKRQAAAILAAHSSAFSREGTSTTANPPMTSLVSGYGPSVTVPSVATMLARWLSKF